MWVSTEYLCMCVHLLYFINRGTFVNILTLSPSTPPKTQKCPYIGYFDKILSLQIPFSRVETRLICYLQTTIPLNNVLSFGDRCQLQSMVLVYLSHTLNITYILWRSPNAYSRPCKQLRLFSRSPFWSSVDSNRMLSTIVIERYVQDLWNDISLLIIIKSEYTKVHISQQGRPVVNLVVSGRYRISVFIIRAQMSPLSTAKQISGNKSPHYREVARSTI